MNTLGDRIRSLRVQKGLNQGQLAKGICTSSMISQIESNKAYPSQKTLFALAERLEVSMGLLLENLELGLESRSKFTLAKALQAAGDYHFALALLEELQLADSTLPVLEYEYCLSLCYAQTRQWGKAFSMLDQLLESAVVRADRHMIILALLAHGDVAARQRVYPLAFHYTERALNEYGKLKEPVPDIHAKVLAQLASLYEQIGLVDKATRSYQELLTIYEHISDPAHASHTYLSLAKSYQAQGQFDKSFEYASRALSLFQQLSDQQAVTDTQIQLLLLTCNESNWTSTVGELLAIAVDLEEQEDKREQAGKLFATLSAVCLQFDNVEQAEVLAEDALNILSSHHAGAGTAHRTLAIIRLHQNRMEVANDHLDHSIAIFMEHGMVVELEETTRIMTENFSRLGRYKESFEHLQGYHNYVVQQMGEGGVFL